MIHPPSGPLSAGAWQPPSRGLCPPLIETWLPKADLQRPSPHRPLPPPTGCVNKGVCPARCTGRAWGRLPGGWAGRPTWLVPAQLPGDLGPSCRQGGEVCSPTVHTGPRAGWGAGMPAQPLLEPQDAQPRTPAAAGGGDTELPVQGHVSPSRPSSSPTGKTRHWPGARVSPGLGEGGSTPRRKSSPVSPLLERSQRPRA